MNQNAVNPIRCLAYTLLRKDVSTKNESKKKNSGC